MQRSEGIISEKKSISYMQNPAIYSVVWTENGLIAVHNALLNTFKNGSDVPKRSPVKMNPGLCVGPTGDLGK